MKHIELRKEDFIEQLNNLISVHQRAAAATMASTERLLQEQTKREQAAFERLGKLIDANKKVPPGQRARRHFLILSALYQKFSVLLYLQIESAWQLLQKLNSLRK